jgi:hypothetical protein
MWIDDLSPYGDSPRIVAVGWLERGHAYPVGEVSAEVYAKLKDLLVAPWQPVYQPPVEFLRAVTACHSMGSPEYRRALLSSGGPGFLAAAGAP